MQCRIDLETEFRDKTTVHEISIMAEAVRMAVETAESAGATRVLALRLRVGALSGVVPEALQFAFEALAKGTAAENATMSIEHVTAKFWCEGCQLLFDSETFFPGCPSCKETSHSLRAGRELALTSVEVE